VVRVYKDHKRPLTSSAFDIRFQEEIPEEDLSALYDEGADAFLGGRDPDEVDENEAIEYATKYGHVALSMLYPWLFEARRKEAHAATISSRSDFLTWLIYGTGGLGPRSDTCRKYNQETTSAKRPPITS
jgi:hypothetical protein